MKYGQNNKKKRKIVHNELSIRVLLSYVFFSSKVISELQKKRNSRDEKGVNKKKK